MSLRLLCIGNPRAYKRGATDVGLGYARLAAHPDVELWHAETEAVLTADDALPSAPVASGFAEDAFDALPDQKTEDVPIEFFDLAFDRTLKPFPSGYLQKLVALSAKTPLFNDPAGIQRQLRHRFGVEAARDFLPPFSLAEDARALAGFLDAHETVVAKRANSCGGRGVFKITRAPEGGGLETDNVVEGVRRHASPETLFEALHAGDDEPLLLMRYLPRVVEGERRLVAVDGEVYGAYGRHAKGGHWVQNVSQGARVSLDSVSERDRAIVAATAPAYSDAGIRLLGYDLLRDDDGHFVVGEINAGNVGGLFRLEALGVGGITDRFVEALRRASR